MKLYLDDQGEPRSTGEPLKLPPKERQVLALLIAASPATVSRETLIQLAWPERQASADSLARSISQIRRKVPGIALDSAYGHGYRLSNTVLNPDPQMQSAARASSASLSAYLHANGLLAQRSEVTLRMAVSTLQSLLQQDPGYAPGHVLLATSIAATLAWGCNESMALGAEDAFRHLDIAVQLDPDCPGHEACRAWLLALTWRFDEAAPLFRLALQRTPHDAQALYQYGWYFLACGDPVRAEPHFLSARQLQPYAPLPGTLLAYTCQLQDRWDDALECAAQAAAIYPPNPVAEFSLMLSRLKRQPTPALAEEARALYLRRERKPIFGAVLAYALARLQQVDESLQLISDQLDRTALRTSEHLYLVFALVELGRIEQAAGIVQAVFDRGCGLLPMVLSDPVLAPLLQHPAVARIQASLKARVPAAA